jgi:hypothetical protein
MKIKEKNLIKLEININNKKTNKMNEKSNGLNLPAIKKNDGLVSKPNKTIVPLNLSKKTTINAILNTSANSIQKEILEAEKGLDLVLVGDLTASMTSYHRLLKDKFKLLCVELFSLIKNLRIAIVFYQDHDAHLPYLTTVSKLTSDVEKLNYFIEYTPVSVGGNSTIDEAVEDAFNDILNLNWKEIGNRSVVLFGDAQPHEPEECPNRFSYFDLTKKMYENNITVNSVYCGEDYSGDEQLQRLKNVKVGDFSERISRIGHANFFSWVANVTGGMILGIENIEDLVDIILASAAKDSGNLDDLEEKMKKTSPTKLKLIEIARKAEQRKGLGNGSQNKRLK